MLNIDIEYKRGILFVRLDGILNEKTSCILEDVLKSVVHKAGIKYVLINFEKLYELDKSVISTIIKSYNECLKDNGKLMICGCNNVIKLKIEHSELIKYAQSTANELCAFNIVNI